jgi:hypothetical protein
MRGGGDRRVILVLLATILALTITAVGLVIVSFRRDNTGLALAGMVVMIGAGVLAAAFAGFDSA